MARLQNRLETAGASTIERRVDKVDSRLTSP